MGTQGRPTTPPRDGDLVADGRYRVLRTLGQGGMGLVLLAEATQSGDSVAVKMLLPGADEEAAARLRDEGRAMSAVRHPSLMAVLDQVDDATRGPLVVMEHLPGTTLRHHLDSAGPLGWRAVLRRIAPPLLGALDALHEAGVVHRDVKPENLLEDGAGSWRLADLGLASFEGREAKTATGVVVGTPGYLAPERLASAKPPTPAADVYAAAMVLVEAATGRLPFPGRGTALFAAQASTIVTPALLTGLGLPPGPARILARALDRDPAARPGTAGELRTQLAGPAPGRGGPSTAPTQASLPALSLPGEESSPPAPPRFRFVLPLIGLVVLVGLLAHLLPGEEPHGPRRSAHLLASLDSATATETQLRELLTDLAPLTAVGSDPDTVRRAFDSLLAPSPAPPTAALCLARGWLAARSGDPVGARSLLDEARAILARRVETARRAGAPLDGLLVLEGMALETEAPLLEASARPPRAGVNRWDDDDVMPFMGLLDASRARVRELEEGGHRREAVRHELRLLLLRAEGLARTAHLLRRDGNPVAPLVAAAAADLTTAQAPVLTHPWLEKAERDNRGRRLSTLATDFPDDPALLEIERFLGNPARLVERADAWADGLDARFTIQLRAAARLTFDDVGGRDRVIATLTDEEAALQAVRMVRRAFWRFTVATLAPEPTAASWEGLALASIHAFRLRRINPTVALLLIEAGWGPRLREDILPGEALRALARLADVVADSPEGSRSADLSLILAGHRILDEFAERTQSAERSALLAAVAAALARVERSTLARLALEARLAYFRGEPGTLDLIGGALPLVDASSRAGELDSMAQNHLAECWDLLFDTATRLSRLSAVQDSARRCAETGDEAARLAPTSLEARRLQLIGWLTEAEWILAGGPASAARRLDLGRLLQNLPMSGDTILDRYARRRLSAIAALARPR